LIKSSQIFCEIWPNITSCNIPQLGSKLKIALNSMLLSRKLDKNTLVFNLMIRQPDFVTKEFYSDVLERTIKKKPHELLKRVKFEKIKEGKCIQMLHLGSYDDEPASFDIMEQFSKEQGLTRISRTHREIYLSDARKVSPEKLKTVLRFKVK
jgi:hypothetical protein